ncbi:rho family-interacting cell polarization regulator 1 isoform X2 [Bufo bufo]|uniref:rho family-interacting cell polarization regulator 1 isoform X2 n=1 Tax=Bufo bufo TaxID=8384 RepID=UPI001ABDC6CB|nr:rho family-interacting cell polarization regulator 1 isoform X2 [Bufo bufo]
MNVNLQGSTHKAHSTMTLYMQSSRVISTSITRSQSFAGVNSNYEKTRHRQAFHTPTVSRKSGSKVRRMFSMSHKSPPPKVPQPDRVDEVYNALKRGLGAYLEVHQVELDKLSVQIRESKRNSRLGFLYDLDKQVKSIERFIRKLEFHTSKIDELYEAYCIQRRLRDGAHNMVRAFSSSPSSKEARESMTEAGKGYKEYTENMCVLENELESQLGEFRIKMKGLAGFARLCAGDQYEIFMKYGRQRWKLKGRIEVNGKQVWDSEDMVFLPLITEFLSIKVTELKSLANHVIVGSVSCETKDLFAALPQVVAVDINDLGTIKLNLEVNWNPFDKEDQPSAASTVNKTSTVNKRFSTYNPSPPDTPSLREQAFYSSLLPDLGKHSWPMLVMLRETLTDKLSQACSCNDVSSVQVNTYEQDYYNMLRRQDDLENGAAWSISSESSDDSSSPQLPSSTWHTPKNIVQPELQASAPDIEISFTQTDESVVTGADISTQEVENDVKIGNEIVASTKGSVANGHVVYSRTLSHISEVSFDAAGSDFHVLDEPQITLPLDKDVLESVAVQDNCEKVDSFQITAQLTCAKEEEKEILHIKPEADVEQVIIDSSQSLNSETQVQEIVPCAEEFELVLNNLVETQQSVVHGSPTNPPCLDTVPEERESPIFAVVYSDSTKRKNVDGVDEAINSLSSSLDDYRGQFPELQALEIKLRHLEEILMKQGVFRSRASSISLTVENALESFDFLNTTSDMEDSECSEGEGVPNERSESSEAVPVTPIEQKKAKMEDVVVCSSSEGLSNPLTTGSEQLDKALVLHLHNCNRLLLHLGTFGPLRCHELYALDKLMREAHILDMICTLTEEKSGRAHSAVEVLKFSTPKERIVEFWNECVQPSDVFVCSVETILQSLSIQYAEKINLQQQGLSDAVFVKLLEDILDQKLPRRSRTTEGEHITIFQYWRYFDSTTVTDLDALMRDLSKEVMFVQKLNSDDQNVVLKALKRVSESSIQKEGFKTLSLLLTNGNSRVIAAASSLLKSFAEQQPFRERALVSYLEQLEDEDVHVRVAGCAALGCLKAKESIEQLVYLCQTDKEEVKEAAKHSLILFGEDGKIAFRHLEETLGNLPRLFAPGAMASTAF